MVEGGMRRLVVAVVVASGLVGALLFASDEGRPCRGVELRGGAPVDADLAVGNRPSIGGTGVPLLRRAFGDDQVRYCHDFADPYVLVQDGERFAYSTATDDMAVPVLTGGGIFGDGTRRDALAGLPAWAAQDGSRVWAPSVVPLRGRYVLYYTLGMPDGRQCISVATADDPAGEFVDRSSHPLICPPNGAIDPSPFVEGDGRVFLMWKDFTHDAVVASEVSADGMAVVGYVHVLVAADRAWEAGVTEAPSMVLADDGHHYLFYSANDWRTADYAVGYAVCDGPLGPCDKPVGGPWLAATNDAQGPGGASLFRDGDGLWMVVHAWVNGRVGYPDGARSLFVLRVVFTEEGPVAM